MPLCLVFPFITIKGLLFLFYSRLTRRLQRFRWNTGTCLTFTTKHSALLYCLILGDNAGEDGGIITAHVLNKKKALWNNRRAPCPFLFSSTHSIFSRIFILGERRHHRRFCWSQRSPAKGWRQKNRINIHHPVAGCQRLERKKSEAINLLSWTWCVGYLTRMFSAFNYSPKSPSPTRIKSYFKVKWRRRCRDRGHAADNGHRRLQQERLFFFRRAHQSGTRRSFLVCRPQ